MPQRSTTHPLTSPPAAFQLEDIPNRKAPPSPMCPVFSQRGSHWRAGSPDQRRADVSRGYRAEKTAIPRTIKNTQESADRPAMMAIAHRRRTLAFAY